MKWELVESRKSSVTKGKHLILTTAFNEKKALSISEKQELLSLSISLAEHYAIEKGNYRIGLNGQKIVHSSNFHIHIILPADDDKLPRFVNNIN